MKIYLISFDLKKPGKDYTGLYEVLKSFPGWWHYLESTWLVATEETENNANAIFEELKPHLDEKHDNVFIIKITSRDHQGWLSEKAWDWIEEHLGAD